MFQLHDRTRRRIGLAAFFLVCLLPTTLLIGWGVARRSSWYVRSEADRLGSLWGLCVSLQGMRHVRPGAIEYQGLDLSDQETGAKMFHCGRLEAVWKTLAVAQAERRPTLILTASQAEVFLDQADQIQRLVERLLTQRVATDAAVRLLAAETVLRTADGAQSISEVQGKAEIQAAGSLAEIRFRWRRDDHGDPVLMRVVRNRQTTPPTTGFELATGRTFLPCPVLALGFRGMEPLGSRSQFCGYFGANETPDGWAGKIEGQLSDVDIESLLGDRFPHRLSGLAQVNLESARFRQGRIELATGEIVAGPGLMSRSLVEAAVERLLLSAGPAANTTASPVRYERLACQFYLDSRGLWLLGRCDAGGGRAILTDRQRVLLGEPTSQPQPVAALVQTLVPAGGMQVSATRQADWLLRRLPLPDLPSPAATAPDPTSPGAPANEVTMQQ